MQTFVSHSKLTAFNYQRLPTIYQERKPFAQSTLCINCKIRYPISILPQIKCECTELYIWTIYFSRKWKDMPTTLSEITCATVHNYDPHSFQHRNLHLVYEGFGCRLQIYDTTTGSNVIMSLDLGKTENDKVGRVLQCMNCSNVCQFFKTQDQLENWIRRRNSNWQKWLLLAIHGLSRVSHINVGRRTVKINLTYIHHRSSHASYTAIVVWPTAFVSEKEWPI